jgi:CysZ protein
MQFLNGILYNFKGLWFGIKSGKLFFWGLMRIIAVIVLTLISVGLIFAYHEEIMALIWARPESKWILWLWYLLSWLLSLILLALATLLSYLLAQVLFSVVIMDYMSRITEYKVTGSVTGSDQMPFWQLFVHLIKQEIPRALFPVLISLLVMVLGWFVALGPILLLLSPGVAVVFLAWDNTDLIPARRLIPFRLRFRYLLRTLPFHLGFGLPFLIPLLNIVLLSFAPVGATLHYIDRQGDLNQTISK